MLPVVMAPANALERLPGILELAPAALQAWLKERDQPALRGRQIRRWLLAGGAESFEQMSDLPKALRFIHRINCVW